VRTPSPAASPAPAAAPAWSRRGERAVGSDGAGKLERARERLPVVDEPVDQAELARPLGGDGLAGQGHLHRLVVRQPQQPASGSDEAALDLRQPELRAAGGGDEVARQDDLEAAGERVALDNGDERLAGERLGEPREAATLDLGRLAPRERLEVHAGAERAAPPVRTPTCRSSRWSSSSRPAASCSLVARSTALRACGR